MPAFPRRTYAVGDTVRLKPGSKPFTDMAATGVVKEVRDNALRLQLGIHVALVPLEKVQTP
jgi:transcription elongation factor